VFAVPLGLLFLLSPSVFFFLSGVGCVAAPILLLTNAVRQLFPPSSSFLDPPLFFSVHDQLFSHAVLCFVPTPPRPSSSHYSNVSCGRTFQGLTGGFPGLFSFLPLVSLFVLLPTFRWSCHNSPRGSNMWVGPSVFLPLLFLHTSPFSLFPSFDPQDPPNFVFSFH